MRQELFQLCAISSFERSKGETENSQHPSAWERCDSAFSPPGPPATPPKKVRVRTLVAPALDHKPVPSPWFRQGN